jgi:hypothetical protein
MTMGVLLRKFAGRNQSIETTPGGTCGSGNGVTQWEPEEHKLDLATGRRIDRQTDIQTDRQTEAIWAYHRWAAAGSWGPFQSRQV